MRVRRLFAGLLTVLLLTVVLGGCDAYLPTFMDYNVSGYIDGLLRSSYKGEHDGFINFTQGSQENAQANNDLIVENGAVHFCNAFGLFPSEDQMVKIRDIVRKAYSQVKFTVKDKVATADGYDVDVEIEPLVIFRNLTGDFEQALNDVQLGNLNITTPDNSGEAQPEGENQEAETPAEGETPAAPAPAEEKKGFDEQALLVDEIIRICQNALEGTLPYDPPTTVTMHILQSDEGVLSLDRTQLGEIDVTVILFAKAEPAGEGG